MRRKLTALGVATGCVIALQGAAVAESPPPPPAFKITLSDQYPHAGDRIVVYFVGRPSTTVKLYLDTPSNTLGAVITSSTGYGRKTFILSKYAKPGSRHAIVLKGPGSTERTAAPIMIQRPGHDVTISS